MSSKFLKVIFAAVMSIGLIGQVNASTIYYFEDGQNYTDADGKLWEYLGAFDVSDGPLFSTAPTPLNGLETAVHLGFGDIEDLAISAFSFDVGNGLLTDSEFAIEQADAASVGISIFEVNFKSWYDGFGSSVSLFGQGIKADADNDGKYTFGTDKSAFVHDRARSGEYINYVFKTVSVPEPSTFAIFLLALCGLGARLAKR
ncbi:PEP-CTERM sorting domain-containing protein [Paraglaciecola arctica]|uniref:Ice-binding protein C-terminal domain-containing protein n=1 Tax=Paraglaciecola arctica BSs20135 TaxID=493475 RepID=K6YS15_9ALTE|nr:PEP-CTERM sorting domain-containing protein [Paraglaciecola arctica]GAC20947.1 hypothetical protein GARC_4000 [Paraglaciecola arctica BSs20135]